MGDPFDFSRKHPVFDLHIQKTGPEFSEIDDKRETYIKSFTGKIPVEPRIMIPKNIPGLTPLKGPLPQNRKWWRYPGAAFERNGSLNLATHNFATRISFPIIFFGLIWGWWSHQTTGYYNMKHYDNGEGPLFYDKMNLRAQPQIKLWNRPG